MIFTFNVQCLRSSFDFVLITFILFLSPLLVFVFVSSWFAWIPIRRVSFVFRSIIFTRTLSRPEYFRRSFLSLSRVYVGVI